jgi:hypothetical protein
MEFLLLPTNRGNPPIPIPRTPYVCRERYDGGPFLSYPSRVGKPEATGASFDLVKYQLSEWVSATPVQDQESFVQSWLYFGFIAELLCATSTDTPKNTSIEPGASAARTASTEIIDAIYDALVVEDRSEKYVRLDIETLSPVWDIAKSRLPEAEDIEGNRKYYQHLISCLNSAHAVWVSVPKEFNHMVKYAIAAFAELIETHIRIELNKFDVKVQFGHQWSEGYLNEYAQESMLAHGWCPIDVARAKAKFGTIQALNVARMMDKTMPERDHSHCTAFACNIGQIDKNYQLRHQQEDCLCEPLLIQQQLLDTILVREDRFPLLRLNGNLHNLSADIVEYTPGIPYIAISHVWVDGLGNSNANLLHRCKLFHLRELVNKFNIDEPQHKSPLIWLDTLCCPALDGVGKQKAIEKIRLVYQKANLVLVLDSVLMAYEYRMQTIPERVMRVFTSGWMRRVWTLQEGALARALYVQFADGALPLSGLRELFGYNNPREQVFSQDVSLEYWRLDAFFRADQHSMVGDYPDFNVLDQALQFRNVSVPSDEGLCIGTLMSLDLKKILNVPYAKRMQKVWELLAIEKRGVPADILFFEEPKLEATGWRWAPRSLLTVQYGIHDPTTRTVRWNSPRRGMPTDWGLKVQYGGYHISVVTYADSRPRRPWPGFQQIPGYHLLFRDAETGEWYQLSDKGQHLPAEEREKYNNIVGLFPLHDVANTRQSVIILRKGAGGLGPDEGIFAIPNLEATTKEQNYGIAVNAKHHVLIRRLFANERYIYETVQQLALCLRDHEVTDKHLKIYDDFARAHENSGDWTEVILEDEEFKASKETLRKHMREMMAKVVAEDSRFVDAVNAYIGKDYIEYVWVLIQDWFNHDYTGEQINDEQVWYVD